MLCPFLRYFRSDAGELTFAARPIKYLIFFGVLIFGHNRNLVKTLVHCNAVSRGFFHKNIAISMFYHPRHSQHINL